MRVAGIDHVMLGGAACDIDGERLAHHAVRLSQIALPAGEAGGQVRVGTQRLPVVNLRQACEVIGRWQHGGRPFQRPGPPEISRRAMAHDEMKHDLDQHHHQPECEDEAADR